MPVTTDCPGQLRRLQSSAFGHWPCLVRVSAWESGSQQESALDWGWGWDSVLGLELNPAWEWAWVNQEAQGSWSDWRLQHNRQAAKPVQAKVHSEK
jgi:hypothetical protein